LGKTPHSYVLDRRLDLAQQLLLETNLRIVEIAVRCGFSSQSQMTTTFHHRLGITPGQYRADCA
jgi:AraC family transcriptional regulator